jgi:uncharacterized protein (TIGR03437 family)
MSGAERRADLDRRLQAHFATLRHGRPGHWQLYAAVTGSAVAMVTSLSAAVIGSEVRETPLQPSANVVPGTQQAASMRSMPVLGAVRAAMKAQAAGPPSIQTNGVVPLYGTNPVIQPGEWISIYGGNLAATTANWNGDFPILLGGTSVKINGKAAYLLFVSPGQINLQAPDDTARGTVPVEVTTAAGTATTTVTLSTYAPSFELSDTVHVAGIILRPRNNGFYGGGAYDILGSANATGSIRTVPAVPGDTVELYGVGFGPTLPHVPAGQAFSGSAPINSPFGLYINNVPVTPSFVGISAAGVYQINLVVPDGLGQGDVPITAGVGGLQSQAGVLFPLAQNYISGTYPGGTVGSGGVPPPVFFSSGPPPGGSGGGGSGGGSGYARKHKWHPKLKFPEQK